MHRFLPLLFLTAACASGSGAAALEVDGGWVRTFPTDRDRAYHAALAVLGEEGYTIERANPLGGSITAQSPVQSAFVPLYGRMLRYTRARVDLDAGLDEGTRVRLVLVRTHEPAGAGRRPNNDRTVTERAPYEALLDKIGRAILR